MKRNVTLLSLVLGAMAGLGHLVLSAGLGTRNLVNQVDDISGSQIHVMYVLPLDGVDEQLDINGTIATSIGAAQYWLRGQTGGRDLRFDTRSGSLDITFLRLNRTNAVMQAFGAFVRDEMESELVARGYVQPGKLYLAYYGGGHNNSCGDAAHPPALVGQVSAMYLKGTPPNAAACATNVLGGSPTVPAYWEMTAVHEVLHLLGAVPTCAPNHALNGHVSDNPNDLMYAGALPWSPSTLDIGHNDYYGHGNGACFDFATSPFLGLPIPDGSAAGAIYFANDMESGAGGIVANSPWAITTEDAHGGTHSWSDSPGGPYGPNVNSSLFLPALNLSGATSPRLTFWQRRDLAPDGVDAGRVWVTVDGGINYQLQEVYSGATSGWIVSSLDLSAYAGSSSVRVIFQMDSNAATSGDGWHIDDVSVREASFVTNGHFNAGMTGWQPFQPGTIVHNSAANGVFEYYRADSGQGVVLQNTNRAVASGTALLTEVDFGNSSSVRKRISVLIHDGDFSDLSVCTFWLPPNLPMTTYRMRTHTTEAWTNATISIYSATIGFDDGFYRVDNVVMKDAPSLASNRTDCVDALSPTAPGGAAQPELLTNGNFTAGEAGWSVFGQLQRQVNGGVFEFYRPAPPLADPAGGILQSTSTALAAGEAVTAQLDLGNSSNARRRVTVLLHDLNFLDLHACTFWLAPGQPLSSYSMRTYATRPWTNLTISIYAATPGNETWTRLDNVSLRKAPGAPTAGSDCIEPTGVLVGEPAPTPDHR